MQKPQDIPVITILMVIGWTLAITEYSNTARLQKQIDNLPPKHLLEAVRHNSEKMDAHIRDHNNQCK